MSPCANPVTNIFWKPKATDPRWFYRVLFYDTNLLFVYQKYNLFCINLKPGQGYLPTELRLKLRLYDSFSLKSL